MTVAPNHLVTEYLRVNDREIMDDEARSALKRLTDTQFAIIVVAALHSGAGARLGIDCPLRATDSTLQDYDKLREYKWAQKGYRTVLDIEAPAIKYHGFSWYHSEPTSAAIVVVVDFDDFRVVVN